MFFKGAVTHVGSAFRLEVSPKHQIGLKLPEMELQGEIPRREDEFGHEMELPSQMISKLPDRNGIELPQMLWSLM